MMMRKRFVKCNVLPLVLGFFLVLLFKTLVWGEGKNKEEKLIFDLRQLINRAISKSPEMSEVESKIAAAESDLDQVKAAYYPQIDLTAVAGPVSDADEPVIRNNKIHDPSPGTSLSTLGVFGRLDFTVTQPLYTFGKLFYEREAAKSGVNVRKYELLRKKNEIALRIIQLYYGLILSRQGVDAANEAGDFFNDARKRINRLLDLGSPNVTKSDLYRIDAYQANSMRSRAEAEKGAQLAYFALKSFIELPENVDFDVAEKSLSMPKKPLQPMNYYIQKALVLRPEFKQLKEALDAQKFHLEAVKSERYPFFFAALEGSFAGAPGRDHLDNPYISDEFNHGYAGVVVGLKWNFDFGISKAKINKEQAEYFKLLHTKASAETNIRVQVAKCYEEVKEWKRAVVAYCKAATASRKWVVTALTNFDMGIGTAGDMLNAIERYGDNKGKYLEALFNYNLSLAELEIAAGMMDFGGSY